MYLLDILKLGPQKGQRSLEETWKTSTALHLERNSSKKVSMRVNHPHNCTKKNRPSFVISAIQDVSVFSPIHQTTGYFMFVRSEKQLSFFK